MNESINELPVRVMEELSLIKIEGLIFSKTPKTVLLISQQPNIAQYVPWSKRNIFCFDSILHTFIVPASVKTLFFHIGDLKMLPSFGTHHIHLYGGGLIWQTGIEMIISLEPDVRFTSRGCKFIVFILILERPFSQRVL